MSGKVVWRLRVSFTTPAFLGGADQAGEWRTPPFKALLRQWWRVAAARECGNGKDVKRLREREKALFGAAAETRKGTGRSKVSLRLVHDDDPIAWKKGERASWTEKGFCPVEEGGVRSDLYLGFGPVNFRKDLEHPPAIDVGEKRKLLVSLVSDHQQERKTLELALRLAAWFGTMGSRSRNGWGSLVLEGEGIRSAHLPTRSDLQSVLEDWTRCLDREWPAALGQDEQGALIWAKRVDSWMEAINELGAIRKRMRRVAKDFLGPGIKGSVLLGYPMAGYSCRALKQDARIPNQMRFKVLPNGRGCTCLVFHMPCAIPDSLWEQDRRREEAIMRTKEWVKENQKQIWYAVHRVLDADASLHRIGKNDAGNAR